jgi:hypothetical protein
MTQNNPRYEQYKGKTIEEILRSLDADAQAESDTYQFLENLLRCRSATLVYNGLTENAGATARSAKLVEEGISALTKALQDGSRDLQAASAQSSIAAHRLNRLTLVLALATGIMALVAGFQSWESKRQADSIETQLKQTTSIPAGEPRSSVRERRFSEARFADSSTQ